MALAMIINFPTQNIFYELVQKTVQNLEFVKYDEANNVILIKGNVPGAKNSYVVVKNAVKAKNAAINPAALA